MRNMRTRTHFVIVMENFPERDTPVRSSVVTAQLGEEDSLWVLELMPRLELVSASLYRRDHLSTPVQVCLTLLIQGHTVTSSHLVPRLEDTQVERLGVHLHSALTHQDTVSTLRVECELIVRLPQDRLSLSNWDRKTSLPELTHLTSWFPERQYSLSDLDGEMGHCQIRREMGHCQIRRLEEKHLVFGGVEEVHYLTRRPRLTVWDRISRGWDMILEGIEAGDIRNPYMLLPVHV